MTGMPVGETIEFLVIRMNKEAKLSLLRLNFMLKIGGYFMKGNLPLRY